MIHAKVQTLFFSATLHTPEATGMARLSPALLTALETTWIWKPSDLEGGFPWLLSHKIFELPERSIWIQFHQTTHIKTINHQVLFPAGETDDWWHHGSTYLGGPQGQGRDQFSAGLWRPQNDHFGWIKQHRGFLSHGGSPSYHPFKIRIFHYKPSILASPHFWKPPYGKSNKHRENFGIVTCPKWSKISYADIELYLFMLSTDPRWYNHGWYMRIIYIYTCIWLGLAHYVHCVLVFFHIYICIHHMLTCRLYNMRI